MEIIIAALLGYFLGSIPFGLILTKLAGHGDIRKIGSGNIGATNVLRTGNKKLAVLTLLLDMTKGAAAVFITYFFMQEYLLFENSTCMSIDCAPLVFPFPSIETFSAGFFALLGHMFPVWLKFKGGKGVATALGVLLALSWQVGLAVAATWLLVAVVFRISSLAALVAVALSPVYAFVFFSDKNLIIFCCVAGFLVIAKHHANIRRLLKGEEPKIGKKKDA